MKICTPRLLTKLPKWPTQGDSSALSVGVPPISFAVRRGVLAVLTGATPAVSYGPTVAKIGSLMPELP